MNDRGPNKGSVNYWLHSFEVGEIRYKETSLETYANDMRAITLPAERRPNVMKDMKFTSSLFTAVSCSLAGDIHYLLRVVRIK